MNVPSLPSILRALALVACLAVGVGCGAATAMQPTALNPTALEPSDTSTPAAETSCAGDVCFTYADR